MRVKENSNFSCRSGRSELFNGLPIQDGRCHIEAARLWQREEPLDVVVKLFQSVVRPSLNFFEVATAGIWFGATVKLDDPGVHRHGWNLLSVSIVHRRET